MDSLPPARPAERRRFYFTPIVAGIVGAAQLSTACFIARPAQSTDIMLAGATGPYLVWSIPVGALIGVAVGWLLLRVRPYPGVWRDRRKSWFAAMAASLLVAPMAPGFLGLGAQTTTQLWQGFVALSIIAWVCAIGLIFFELWALP